MATDSKTLRRYQAGVERALGLFDATNEWADYIAFLSRLLKALQASPPDADIPLKIKLAKYLAQCLRPSLPSGVHQKALEIYNLVFTLLGREGLSRDLPLYLPGLSHTLSFASLSTRPWVLALYEEHILQLSPVVIRPALKAIILSLLPGIEEENNEDFEKTLATFNKVRRIFIEDGSEEIFWQCLFLASITSPNKRTGVLVYLIRYLPKLDEDFDHAASGGSKIDYEIPDVAAVTTPEPGLLLRCFATGLQDDQTLVQRGFLDLLVTHLPLKASALQTKVTHTDLDILVSSAMSIVLRRDMGLNRRLWAWFTGSEDKHESPGVLSPNLSQELHQITVKENGILSIFSNSKYFLSFGLASTIRSFEKMLAKGSFLASDRARPFRILLSLMDRWTVGGPVVNAMFAPFFKDLKVYQTSAPSQGAFDEVFRSANVFFDGIEPRLVACHLFKLLEKNDLDLVEFVIGNFNLDEDELSRLHLPRIVWFLSNRLLEDSQPNSVNLKSGIDDLSQLRTANILDSLLQLLPSKDHAATDSCKSQIYASDNWSSELSHFYANDLYALKSHDIPMNSDQVDIMLLINLATAVLRCIHGTLSLSLLDLLSAAFEKAGTRVNSFDTLKQLDMVSHLSVWCQNSLQSGLRNFTIARNIVKIVGTIHTYDVKHQSLDDADLLRIVPALVWHFWQCLKPATPQYHVESVELIWTLRSLSTPLLVVDSSLMSLLSAPPGSANHTRQTMANFGIFWTHTRMVDSTLSNMPNSNSVSNENALLSLLRRPILYILDQADPADRDDPHKRWMSSLQSLRILFQVSLEEVGRDDEEPQGVLPRLHRVQKLIAIARQTMAQWKDLIDSTGPLASILVWTASLINHGSENHDWALEALAVIRLVHEGAEAPYSGGLIENLTQHLSKSADGSDLQTSLLETIQTLVALAKAETPPLGLLNVLVAGISSRRIDSNIDKWITLVCNLIPRYSGNIFFSNLLKMTACFCQRILKYFEILKNLHTVSDDEAPQGVQTTFEGLENPERSITNLFAGLEYILARAHTQVTEQPRNSSDNHGSPNADAPKLRSLANDRLTVILCMQDSIRVCGQVWLWRSLKSSAVSAIDTKSFNYTSTRLRNRTRKMLENLIDAEPQECLETMMGMWVDAAKNTSNQHLVLNLLQTLDGARPKFMIPATFNAIYSRTNPGALDQAQKSSLSVDVNALELMAFLVEYIDALEDDLLEEIWTDCTTFLRDLLANPMPHRQILLRLLEFESILCKKMENTNFGEETKMRRELADLCARLFTAIFAVKPGGFDHASTRSDEKSVAETESRTKSGPRFDSGNGLAILCEALPLMNPVLSESDRAATIYSGISINMTSPLLRSRFFPQNMNEDVLNLLQITSKIASAAKTWRRDISDAFNDQKFFQCPVVLAESGWIPLIRQLSTADKGLLSELTSRLLLPTTAGLMFGVGAAAARTEADKRAQLNLRRIALVLLAAEKDAFVTNLVPLTTKIEELITATPTSSPSLSTRGDIFLLLRAMTLSFAQFNLIPLWPIIDAELRELFNDLMAAGSATEEPRLSLYSHLQGAKLLDLLLLVKPEEFQLHEWLFITDTVDAIYPPTSTTSSNSPPAALADRLAATLATTSTPSNVELQSASSTAAAAAVRKPWLCTELSRDPRVYSALLASFFRHLSIHAFEDTYSLEGVDTVACRSDLLADLFAATGAEVE